MQIPVRKIIRLELEGRGFESRYLLCPVSSFKRVHRYIEVRVVEWRKQNDVISNLTFHSLQPNRLFQISSFHLLSFFSPQKEASESFNRDLIIHQKRGATTFGRSANSPNENSPNCQSRLKLIKAPQYPSPSVSSQVFFVVPACH